MVDHLGRTPLLAALNSLHPRQGMVEYLIAEGSDVNGRDGDGYPLLVYLWRSKLKPQPTIHILQMLLERKVDLNRKYSGKGSLALLLLHCRHKMKDNGKKLMDLCRMLIEGGAPLDDPEIIPIAVAASPQYLQLLANRLRSLGIAISSADLRVEIHPSASSLRIFLMCFSNWQQGRKGLLEFLELPVDSDNCLN